jgi:hypothetical protein
MILILLILQGNSSLKNCYVIFKIRIFDSYFEPDPAQKNQGTLIKVFEKCNVLQTHLIESQFEVVAK